MQRFMTLLRREWMQHHVGWMLMVAIPIALFALAAVFGQVQFDGDDRPDKIPGALVIALATIVGLGLTTLALVWGASMIQAPGLARRDVQDRSIEFWLSLPTGHSQSLGATLLMHLLLAPCLALVAGLAGGVLVSLLVVARINGVGEWLALPWAAIVGTGALLVLRLTLGLALATLWLSPLILGTMAASAWLKRWGLPAVAGVVLIGGLVLKNLYGNPIVFTVLRELGSHASQAFLLADRSDQGRDLVIHHPDDLANLFGAAPGWLLGDLAHAFAALASPSFVLALLAGAAGFALLVLRRQRGA